MNFDDHMSLRHDEPEDPITFLRERICVLENELANLRTGLKILEARRNAEDACLLFGSRPGRLP